MRSPTQSRILTVLHKAKLIIDEKGTEAAAMTVVTIKTTSAQLGDVEMKVDRPYQIFIVDLKNNLILFNGIIQKVSN
jgi:serpin B